MIDMQRDEEGPAIAMDTWGWADAGDVIDMNALLGRIAAETIKNVFDQTPPMVWFPAMFHENDDPLVIAVALPLGRLEEENPRWTISLQAMADDFMDFIGDDDYDSRLANLATSLRGLADHIDARGCIASG